MNQTIDFNKLAGEKGDAKLLKRIHDAIILSVKSIDVRLFPIYIRYIDTKKDLPAALLYFRGKHLERGEVELGLNIGNATVPKGFDNGNRIKYPGINCSIRFPSNEVSKKQLLSIISLIGKS